ncbi:MAG: polyprenol monophosphomannose synthase [Patescibacteria group bacterium]
MKGFSRRTANGKMTSHMSSPTITVLTPTYNERENIKLLIPKIFALGIPNLNMAVVDDASPDGTREAVQEFQPHYPVELFIKPRKEGLGKAYAFAFKKILASSHPPDIIIQMDADLSHDPAAIPEFLSRIQSCDLALGSRYTEGGKIENWDSARRLVSRIGNLYARAVLGVPLSDMTSGYKCWRREVLEALDADSFSSIGYNFQIETTCRAYRQGYRVCEIPITFTERKIGTSKFNLGIMLESFFKVLLLRLK